MEDRKWAIRAVNNFHQLSQAYQENWERIFGKKNGNNKKTKTKIQPIKPAKGN